MLNKRVLFNVCFPSTVTVIKSFKTLRAAREFARKMTDKDVPFLVMPGDENCCPIICREVIK
jgi:hypothetical protein